MDAIATWSRWDLFAALEPERAEPSRVTRLGAEPQSFEGVYRAHYEDVYRYVLLARRRPDDAEDIVADVFDRAYRAWRSGHGPAGRTLPWLLLIARRLVVDRWRRERILRWLPLPDAWTGNEPRDPGDAEGRAELWLWLAQLSAALPDRQREVVLLRYQRDLSDEDIGEILGLSASGVRTLLSRALATLRRHPELWS